jgi:acyl transferase domain-containing protein
MDEMDTTEASASSRHVAIVGMAGRFPGADTPAAFWDNLARGVEALTEFSDEHLRSHQVDPALLAHPAYVKRAPVLSEYDRFDAEFFGFTPRQAEITDPQLRLFIETAHAALEDAGYRPKGVEGLVGVYAGGAMSGYLLNNLLSRPDVTAKVGQMAVIMANDKDYVATMTSYKLNLKGPSVSVNTACSTSLVAVHLARMALLNYECDTALAGGVRITVPQEVGYLHQEGGITSSDGHCRAFDARADGTIGGSGVGVVVLKRLDDALAAGDHIYAVIRGSAINNDGADKVGFSAPGVRGQVAVIQEAHAVAEVDPLDVSYVEAHGTGTALGDPIEIDALTQAFGQVGTGYCAVGSLKTNVGHLDTAAGVASVIKVAQALQHRRLPPSLNYDTPNPKIDFANSPFFVNDRLREWEAGGAGRIAAINSFGIGGTNAHLVLEEAPPRPAPVPGRGKQLLVLSARTETALQQAAERLAEHLRAHPELNLGDVAYTLQVGREPYVHRLALACSSVEQAAQSLTGGARARGRARGAAPKLCFMFPGQGAQHPDMVRSLYRDEPAFRAVFDQCAELLSPHLGADIRDVLVHATLDRDSAAAWLRETRHTQPSLFAIEYALARLLMSRGLAPAAMIGHSLGEYVAACLAGVFSLEDALMLVAVRGRCMQAAEAGTMLAVLLSEPVLRQRLPAGCDLAAVNGPAHCVVAGPVDAVDAFAAQLEAEGIGCRRLHTSHAFHSRSMEPVLAGFAQAMAGVARGAATLPFISNVSGDWADSETGSID